MTELMAASVLLARATWFDSMTHQFSGGNFRFGAFHVLVLALIAASLVIVYWIAGRTGKPGREPRYDHPRALFRALCRAHGLDRASRRLLDQLARQQRLSDPARLFLEPERFEAENLGASLKPRRKQFVALRDRLFAEPTVPANDRRQCGKGPAPRRSQ